MTVSSHFKICANIGDFGMQTSVSLSVNKTFNGIIFGDTYFAGCSLNKPYTGKYFTLCFETAIVL